MKRSDVTYQDKLNELRLDVTHPNSQDITFILLEGESDIRLYRKLFNLNACKVERIPGGKEKLSSALETLLTTYNLVIGIRDADFLHLSDVEFKEVNLFMTDYHDIEICMITQDDIFNAIINEHFPSSMNDSASLRESIMRCIESVSYLKWLNDRENLELTFESGFQDIINAQLHYLDFEQYFNRVVSKSPNAKLIDKTLIEKLIDNLRALEPNLLQLTNGHDYLKALVSYFKQADPKSKVGEANLASSLRIAYTLRHFASSQLFNDVELWSAAQGVVIC